MGVQVQTATRDGQGNSLSILGRQFISFSYGGRNIEDFDLLAVFSGDRLEKGIYSSFEDITTEQDEIDGQIFWGSSSTIIILNIFVSNLSVKIVISNQNPRENAPINVKYITELLTHCDLFIKQ